MGFLKKNKNKIQVPVNDLELNNARKKLPFYKRKGWKIFFGVMAVVLITAISYFGYLISNGSKMFENGFGSGSSLIKTLYGKEDLKNQDGRVNVLILGMGGINHPGGMLSDTIILASLDTKQNKAGMLSIPRDLLVSIPGHGEEKINSSFADGYNDYMNKSCTKKNKDLCYDDAVIAGAKLTKEVVSNILNQEIDYYVTADFDGFEKIIDQLGGIDLNVPKAIYDPTFPASDMKHYETFKIKAGQQHLNGSTALKYARSRHTTSDFDRAQRQQDVIVATKDKALQSGVLTNPKKISDIISTLGKSVKTDLTLAEIKSLFEIFKGVSSSNISSKVLTNGIGGQLVDVNNGVYYLKPRTGNFKEIQAIAKNIFDQEDTTPSKIEVLNGSTKTGLASTISKNLENAGFEISKIGNNTQKVAKSVIYDYTNGKKSKNLELLKTQSGVTNVVVKTDTNQTGVDFTLIIGEDTAGK